MFHPHPCSPSLPLLCFPAVFCHDYVFFFFGIDLYPQNGGMFTAVQATTPTPMLTDNTDPMPRDIPTNQCIPNETTVMPIDSPELSPTPIIIPEPLRLLFMDTDNNNNDEEMVPQSVDHSVDRNMFMPLFPLPFVVDSSVEASRETVLQFWQLPMQSPFPTYSFFVFVC